MEENCWSYYSKKKTTSIIDEMKIKINLNSFDTPVVYIDLITKKTKTDSPV